MKFLISWEKKRRKKLFAKCKTFPRESRQNAMHISNKRMDKVTLWVQSWYSCKNDKLSLFPFSFPWMLCFVYHFGLSSFQLFILPLVSYVTSIGWIFIILECWVLIALFYVKIVQFYFFSYSQTWCNQMMECARDLSLVTNILILFPFIFFFHCRQRIWKFTMVIRQAFVIVHLIVYAFLWG